MPDESSKRVAKSDDAAKDFLRLSLENNFTRGFDIDSVYCEVDADGVHWRLFEFLKCDTVPPETSHPKYYWNSDQGDKGNNWRKFLSLWALCLSIRKAGMKCKLILVNYYDVSAKVKVMEVLEADRARIETKDTIMTFQKWKTYFQTFNKNKVGSTWEVLDYLEKRR
jgi:hypothetical protein